MNLGILLWNTCNAKCSHCAVNSSPTEVGYMRDEQILSLIDQAFYDTSRPRIGMSGGEAFLYFDRLCKFIEYAAAKGAEVSVNTNGFWGTTIEKAVEYVVLLKKIGLTQLVVSSDDFHEDYIKIERVLNVIRACKKEHLKVEFQFVATKTSGRLGDFLKKYGDVFINISCREIPCHPVGRANEEINRKDLFLQNEIPQGLCPSAVLSISAFGKVIPCCNTAGHLPALQIGTIEDSLPELHENFLNSALFNVLIKKGPKALVSCAVKAGYETSPDGYIDQCHLCYDLFKDKRISDAIKQEAEEIIETETYEQLSKQFIDALSKAQPVVQ